MAEAAANRWDAVGAAARYLVQATAQSTHKLRERWLAAGEFEDFEDYVAAAHRDTPAGFVLISGCRSPFGFLYRHAATHLDYRVWTTDQKIGVSIASS